MIRKFSSLWFYIFTFILTIILGGVSQVISTNYVSEKYQFLVNLLMLQMAPTLGTVLVCLSIKDWSIWKSMNWNLFSHLKNFLWLFMSYMIPTLIIFSSSIIMSLIGRSYVSNGNTNQIILVTILVSLIGCIGEEIGWRGYLLPTLNKKYSLLVSSIITGILWGTWHIGKIMSFGISGYLLFILFVSELSVIMAWIYSRFNAKMINMVFFHLGVNVTSMILLTNREGILFYSISCIISAIVCLLLFTLDRKKFSFKLDLGNIKTSS